ncbi:hypothetical protein CA265_00535 [Sphingobacteriaceae bacterium GW460-11-11-14-LB5]|nr:hypothetical protein CA265_00535 [Sphingobacteriaceae bacterium GW460-11-11-14-LB5]
MTEAQRKKYFKEVNDDIRKYGYHTTVVLEAENSTPFAYSTGIYEYFKIPELFISGLGPNLSGQLIKNYADQYKLRAVPLNKRITDLTERFPVYFIKVTNESLSDYVLSSIRHYGNEKYEYLQLIFPDLNGNFPDERNYDYDQKIFGKFEPK